MRVKFLNRMVSCSYLFLSGKLTVIGVDGDFMVQGKNGHKKQAWKGSNTEKNSSSHVAEQTRDEENHGSHEHHEDTPKEEVCAAFVFHLGSILASIIGSFPFQDEIILLSSYVRSYK